MCQMKPVLTINLSEIEGKSLNLYNDGETQENGQIFSKADHYFLKQNEVTDAMGYNWPVKKVSIDGIVKCSDSKKACNFIPLPLVIDFLDSIPVTGDRRKNSRIIEQYVTRINTIFRNSYNPLNDIKSEMDATEPPEIINNFDEIEALKKELKEIKDLNSKLIEKLVNAGFCLKRVSAAITSVDIDIKDFFEETRGKEAES